ncbi:MAG: FAD-dependent oxidoreductase, partial [Spirochaetia bacterium]|nr:FAD-dependent oxidoreductase [Spirochaetia bacterium]
AMRTPNLTSHLNTSLQSVEMADPNTVASIRARVSNAETELHIKGKIFIDCTGDGVLADLAGCEWRMGTEGRDEHQEAHAPVKASDDVMGSSIHFVAKDMGRPMPFRAPDWAVRFDDPDFFYKKGRHIGSLESGYWWMEMSVPWHTIYDNEKLRHELTRHVLGVWDWIKNRDPQTKDRAANFALDWIGQVPGKRESRRILGQYLMTEHDVVNGTVFPDECAFGGWYIDLHKAGGLLADFSEQMVVDGDKSAYMAKAFIPPYGIPLRALIAKHFNNLMMAGRNVSVTHVALGTVRTQGTTSLMGQAVGTAAAIALSKKIPVALAPEKCISEIQQALISDGCFLPNVADADPKNAALQARVAASSQEIFSGTEPDLNKANDTAFRLTEKRGQWIALGTDELQTLRVYLKNDSHEAESVDAEILPVETIWDYRLGKSKPFAIQSLKLAPKFQGWVEWKTGLNAQNGLVPGTYLRLDLAANPEVAWIPAREIAHGQLAAYDLGAGAMRRLENGVTLSFQVEPAQPCYGPQNVVRGAARPHRFTNLWRSKKMSGSPEWLELAWDEPAFFSKITLTFDGHLLHDYRFYPSLYRDPAIPKEFKILAEHENKWVEIASVSNNHLRRFEHRLATPLRTKKIRILTQSMNGDPQASLFEVRCEA